MDEQNNNNKVSDNNETSTQQAQANNTQQAQNNSQRLFTQDQLNDIIAERVNVITSKYNTLNTQ